MPSPYHNVSIISRGHSTTVLEAAAYRHATKMETRCQTPTADYSHKQAELVHSEIILPDNAPTWLVNECGKQAFHQNYTDIQQEYESKNEICSSHKLERKAWAHISQRLWQTADHAENILNHRKYSVALARSVTIAIPTMLDTEHQIALVQAYIKDVYSSHQMIADFVIHDTRQNNPHAHILLTLRRPNETFWEAYKAAEWNHVSLLRWQREKWALHANLKLEQLGFNERFRHRKIELQQIELGAKPKIKPENWNIRATPHAIRKGDYQSDRERYDKVRKKNQETLREDPEHILVLAQTEFATFSRSDVKAEFARRLGLSLKHNINELNELTEKAMRSNTLRPVIGKNKPEQHYVTVGKVNLIQQIERDAVKLQASELNKTWEADEQVIRKTQDLVTEINQDNNTAEASRMISKEFSESSAQFDQRNSTTSKVSKGPIPDALESGTGPIFVDISAYSNASHQVDELTEHDNLLPRISAVAAAQGYRNVRPSSATLLREALWARAETLFEIAFGPPVNRREREWRAKENRAVAMQVYGEKRGLWSDHSAAHGGDLFDLVGRHFLGLESARQDFPRVLEQTAQFCGLSTSDLRPDQHKVNQLEKSRVQREAEVKVIEEQERKRRQELVSEVQVIANNINRSGDVVEIDSMHVLDCAAVAYLQSRGIHKVPVEGLSFMSGQSFATSSCGLIEARHDALVVWAYDKNGVVTGGQRILVNRDGTKVDTDVRKPSFGQIRGSIARFSAISDGAPHCPLVIAEGPESALSIWQATGYETWAIFGVSGWKSAPIPANREVILAPDRDASTSPAGMAFRKALAYHLGQGCDLKVACAPETIGSKKDLNDTDMRAGSEAVANAIKNARVARPWLSLKLNPDQIRAAEVMLSSQRLTLVTGHAGTGKTFTLAEVARVWQERGVEVLAGAPSGKATQELSKLDGVEVATLSAWESRWARGQVPKSQLEEKSFVFIMDEAAMVGSGQWARIQSKIGAMGGKFIAVGDPEQLQPIMEVSGWKEAEQAVRFTGGTVAVIGIVQRQSDARDRAATMALAKGDKANIEAAIRHYSDKGSLSLGLENPIEIIARDFVNKGNDNDGFPEFSSRIAIAATNKDVEKLNCAIQAEAIKKGIVDASTRQEFPVEVFERSVDSDGMKVKTRTKQRVRIGVGDRVMLTMPFPSANLPRSSFGTVKNVNPVLLTLRMDGTGDDIEIDPVAFPHFTYGYATTVHKSQGMTVDNVFVLLHRSMDRYGLNVALTRHRNDVQVYAYRKDFKHYKQLIRLGSSHRTPVYKLPLVGVSSMVPVPRTKDVLSRSDWMGTKQQVQTGKMIDDRYLMSIVSRVARLLSANYADNDLILAENNAGTAANYVYDPKQVIDDLVIRHGVFMADEVANAIAQQVRDPETFVRLFVEAMSHNDLVYLPRALGRPGHTEPRVYTTQTHLSAEIKAVDRGLKLALSVHQNQSTKYVINFNDYAPHLDRDQQKVFQIILGNRGQQEIHLQNNLEIIEGGTGSGKTRLASQLAQAIEHSGQQVIVISPTRAGKQALIAEGVKPITLTTYLSQPIPRDLQTKSQKIVILDDAHNLGVEISDIVLARVEAEGSRLIAMVNSSRRPTKAGPIFHRLSERLQELQGVKDQFLDEKPILILHEHHGTETPKLKSLRSCLGAGQSSSDAFSGLQEAIRNGMCAAAETLDDAISDVAKAYIADESMDKLAIVGNRDKAQKLTTAIREILDASDPKRCVFDGPKQRQFESLKPKDRIQFSGSGYVMNADGQSTSTTQINSTDIGTVIDKKGDLLKLTVTGQNLKNSRDIFVSEESELPAWNYAFVSTVIASAGHRHESVHLLVDHNMDREVLTAGIGIARKNLALVVSTPVEEIERTLAAITRREHFPRSGLDYGFDSLRTLRIAKRQVDQVNFNANVLDLNSTERSSDNLELGIDDIDLESVASLPQVNLDEVTLQRANRAYLSANPEHILTLMSYNYAAITKVGIQKALREKANLGLTNSQIKSLVTQILESPELIKLSQTTLDGASQYITTARAVHLRQIREGAARLSAERFAPGEGAVLRPKALDALNAVQSVAAEAMLDATRFTMVTGKAGTGKTFTLRAVASEWWARGVPVLAGAPSGKATAELRGIQGVQAQTLATWEARWVRGEVPKTPFVFIMDEAGMVGAGQWSRVQSRVLALGGKLITVGDPDQLQPVADLPGWALAERATGSRVVLDNVMRQHNIFDRLATEQLARGGDQVAQAMTYYDVSGCLHLTSDVFADPVGALARDYVAAGEGAHPGQSRMALGYSNRDVAALNDHIRDRLKAEALRAAGTIEDASHAAFQGFDLTTERHYGTIRRMFKQHDGTLQSAVTDRLFAVGDRVMATEALTAHGVPKSSFGTVVATDDDRLVLHFDGHEERTVLSAREWGYLDYGYAATVHKSQGLSADVVFVLAHRRMHRHAVYVALSRHRERLSVYGRVGHAESVADLTRLGQAPGSLATEASEIDRLADSASARSIVPEMTTNEVGQRLDWMALTSKSGHPQRAMAVVGDSHAMAVAERLAGLMAAASGDEHTAWVPDGLPDHQRRYLYEPTKVIDDLLQRSSVIRADDIAEKLARVVTEPETFLRLFTQAFAHEELIRLSDRDQQGVPVYTTKTQWCHEVRAVDIGAGLAVSVMSEAAPSMDFKALLRRDWRVRQRVESQYTEAQQLALLLGMEPKRLRLIRGEAGSGKTYVARGLAHLHLKAGWKVYVLVPTGSALSGLEGEEGWVPMTVRRFLRVTDPGQEADVCEERLDVNTVVVIDDATRLGGKDAMAVLARVEQSGAKLIAMLGGEEQQPMSVGPIMRALEMRVGSTWIGHDQIRSPMSATLVSNVLGGGDSAERAMEDLRHYDMLVSGTNARQAITVMAQSYVADPLTDKIALTWSRADAEAVSKAIRAVLDERMPERWGRQRFRHEAVDALKVGDRIRFVSGTAWVPLKAQTPEWRALRIKAGERADVVGFDAKTDALRLHVMARNGQSTRTVVIPAAHYGTLPRWRFAFAGTIHGEGAMVRESVHLLASKGMTRQVFAAGIAAHQAWLKVIVPSSAPRMAEVLRRIHCRDGRAESVLDYGFDATLGVRAALHKIQGDRGVAHSSGLAAAVGRLGAMVGFQRDVLSPAVTRDVLAEVMGAMLAMEAESPGRFEGQDRVALEKYVHCFSQPRAWRQLLRHLPSHVPQAADERAMAVVGFRTEWGVKGSGEAPVMTIARYLSRGALTANALGEETVAAVFEKALERFGDHVHRARVAGKRDLVLRDEGSEQEVQLLRPVESRDGRADRRKVDDRQVAQTALLIAVTIAERVEAANPVHQRDLVGDLTRLLHEGEAIPEVEMTAVKRMGCTLALSRAIFDAKRALAVELVAKDPRDLKVRRFHEEAFRAVEAGRSVSLRHPLEFSHYSIQEEYDERAGDVVHSVKAQSPMPTMMEMAVAKVLYVVDQSAGEDDLRLALRDLFKEGSLLTVDAVMKERARLLVDVAAITDVKDERTAHGFLARLFQSFTHQEIWAFTNQGNDAIAQGLKRLTRFKITSSYYCAWHQAAKQVAGHFHPERTRSKSLGLGL
ncbi:MAG: AAA family ATPase [Aestuariivita sp.]|nr:AAA family ATPase [Aestuariivita sp.]